MLLFVTCRLAEGIGYPKDCPGTPCMVLLGQYLSQMRIKKQVLASENVRQQHGICSVDVVVSRQDTT